MPIRTGWSGVPPAAMPLFGERALHLPDARAVVVGDVHVGLETELHMKGVTLPSQTRRMRERLVRIVESVHAERLIVIGDLKHRIPFSTRQEIRELPWFFEDFPAHVELVPGNHDVDLDGLVAMEIHPIEGIRVGDVALLHGHAWPSPDIMGAPVVVTCHNHPAVLLVDELGHRHKEAAWIRAPFTPAARERYPMLPEGAQLIVMPAFNELTGGTAFNAPEGERLLGPLFGNRLVDVDEARVWTVDGVDLGTIGALRRHGEQPTKRGRRAPRAPKTDRRKGWID